MSESKAELGRRLLARNAQLKSQRGVWDAFWQEIARYVMPRKNQIARKSPPPDTADQDTLFDGTAIQANMIQASGMMSYMVPKGSVWFSFDPPMPLKGSDPAKQWFQHCSDIARVELASSNFYELVHEHFLDRGAFGTAVLFCEEGRRAALGFQTFDVGTFSLGLDDEGYVDTLFREFTLTARQAEQKFGDEVSEEIRKAAREEKRKDAEFEFLHCIYPRAEVERGRLDAENKPIASVYLEVKSGHVNRVSGYDEPAFYASRYLKWGDTAYGWSPSWMALPEARQLNFLEKQMDALAEKAAFPPMLVPSTHEGDIDVRALGVTYYSGVGEGAMPREWQNTGRYDIGKDRAEIKRRAIERAFHVDLFQMFANYEGPQMTAREVAERQGEKLTQFSPTADRTTTELFTPLLRRVFAILARAGKFPPPPPEVMVSEAGGVFVADPEIIYSSRIALAIKALENNAFDRDLETLMPLIQIAPDAVDNYDLDEIVRDRSRNNGLPARWMRDLEEVEEMRAARAQAAAQQAQMRQAEQLAGAAGKAGGIKEDGLVARMLQGGEGG